MTSEAEWLDRALSPQPEDSADVRWALETAIAMWLRGDRERALSWVHNAVQAASAEGQHDRAYALGSVASQLEKRPLPTQRPAVAVNPSSTTQPTAEETAPLEVPAAKGSRPRKSLMQTAPYRIPPDEVTHLIEPDSLLLQACQPGVPSTRAAADMTAQAQPDVSTGPRPVGPSAPGREAPAELSTPSEKQVPRVLERPRPPTIVHDPLDATLTEVRREPVASRDVAEHTVVMTDEELAPPTHGMPSRDPSTLGSPQTVLEPMRAIRVAVRSGSGREIIVDLLGDGETVEEGAQEALLLPLPPQR